jgi:hypothetical protein
MINMMLGVMMMLNDKQKEKELQAWKKEVKN